eukprot:TRINITY_DN9770_c0_g2_i4.p1 TRINITY_DN9770_c0_g2~~TRINITY_DN9770_c0_g2_i4.p1  ORF type:complete len:707 (-),score=93.56 TRINITY_DN9770_c0_g2_i4:283-2403(-)
MGPFPTEFRERLSELAQEHETLLAERDYLRDELRVLRQQLSLGFSSTGLEKPVQQSLPAAAADSEPPGLLKERGGTWILHPSGPFCLVWNVLCINAILYDVIAVPSTAFSFDREGLYLYVEGFLTIFWTVDLIISFRTGYLVGAHLETNQKKIAWHYLQSGFVLDSVIVLVEWSSWITEKLSAASVLKTTRVLRSFKLVKFVRVGKMKEIWVRLQDQINSVVFHICVSLIVISICLAVGVHLTSCAWYWLGTSRADGWVTYDGYEGEKDVVFWYVASARWSIAQLNGRTDEDDRRNMKERAFACFTGVVLAVIIKTTLVSVVTKTVLNLSALRSSKIRRQALVKEYLESHSISYGLQVSVKRHMYDYDNTIDLCSMERQVMSFLPGHLQSDVLCEIRGPTVSSHPLFQCFGVANHATLRHICHAAVKQLSALQGEILFDTGDACSRMLFISRGEIEYGEAAVSVAESSECLPRSEAKDKPTETSSKPLAFLRARTIVGVSRVLAMPRTSQTSGRLKSQCTADFIEPSIDPDTSVVMNNGGWISEPALWVKWANKKRCVASALSVLQAVEAEALSQVLSRHADAYAIAQLYAASFVKELSCSDNLFCVCKIKGDNDDAPRVSIKTDLMEDMSEPVWKHSEELALYRDQLLEFSVWDHTFTNVVHSGKLMGSASLPAAYVLRKGFDGEMQLRDEAGASGSLQVKIELL